MKQMALIATMLIIAGALLCAWNNGWIIVRAPWHASYQAATSTTGSSTLWYFKGAHFHHEQEQMVWKEDMASNAHHLINRLMCVLYEENIVSKQILLETAFTARNNHDLYLSFSRSPCAKQQSSHHAWMIIESVLKTLRENGITPSQIYFLVSGKCMDHPMLDFSHPWPLHGYLG